MTEEAKLFDEHRTWPGETTLVRLLGSCQHRLYNLCFHVLQHEQDAEDAAQQVLVEIARSVDRIHDANHFRRWTYRVAMAVSLNLRRTRGRRVEREKQGARMREVGVLSDDVRDAIHEAINALDDDSRALMIEHYFERTPLQQIAERAGCSKVAVWKRIERSRELVKKSLGAVAVVWTDGYLNDVIPTRARRNLVSGAILQEATTGAGVVVGAKLALRGIAVTSKHAFWAASALAALFLVGMVAHATFRRQARMEPRSASAEPGKRSMPRELSRAEEADALGTVTAAKTAAINAVTPEGVLAARLARYAAFMEALEAEGKKRGVGLVHYYLQQRARVDAELTGMGELICADPRTFLEFARRSVHDRYLDPLLDTITQALQATNSVPTRRPPNFDAMPESLVPGLLQLLTSGTERQILAVLRFSEQYVERPQAYREARLHLLSHRTSAIQYVALQGLRGEPDTAMYDAAVRSLAETTDDLEVRRLSLTHLAKTRTPESDTCLLSLFESNARGFLPSTDELRDVISRCDAAARGRWASAITGAAPALRADPNQYKLLVPLALSLPSDEALPIIESLLPSAPTEEAGAFVRGIAERIRSGRGAYAAPVQTKLVSDERRAKPDPSGAPSPTP